MFISVLFILWFGLTVLYTLFNRRLATYSNRWDVFRLITSYQLFGAPAASYTLSYRTRQTDATLADTSLTEWIDIPLKSGPRWYHPVCFPQKYVHDSILYLIDNMAEAIRAGRHLRTHRPLEERFVYRQILRFVSRRFVFRQGVATPCEFQFRIAENPSPSVAQHTTIFVSGFERP